MMLDRQDRRKRITLGADKGYGAASFVAALRRRRVTPHIARRVSKHGEAHRSKIDRRTTRHPGYAVSQRIRKRIEEVFGWIKLTAGLRQTRFRRCRATNRMRVYGRTAWPPWRCAGPGRLSSTFPSWSIAQRRMALTANSAVS